MRLVYLLLLDVPSTRAHATQTVRTAAALARRGHRVVLHPRVRRGTDAWAWLSGEQGVEPVDGLEVRPLRWGRADLARAALLGRAVGDLLKGDGQTVFYARERRVLVPFLHARNRLRPGAPLVFEWHNLEHRLAAAAGEEGRARRIARAEARVAREVDGIVATTRALARDLEEVFRPDAPVEVVPSGADVEAFAGVGRPAFGDPVRLAYAGSLYPEKGVDLLVRSLAHLPVRVVATVVGGNAPEDLARLRRLAEEEGVASRVTFTGGVPPAEVPSRLAGADLLVLPAAAHEHAQRYTSPLKLFEAMATGIPVVAGPSPAYLEVLEDGRNALVAGEGGPEGLAAAVRRALDDPDAAREVGRRAAVEARAYSWDRRAERIEAFLERVLEGRGR